MHLIHQQFSTAAQQQLTQQLHVAETLANTTFESLEKLISLHFRLTRQAFDDFSQNAQQLYEKAGNPTLLPAIENLAAPTALDKLLEYGRELNEISSDVRTRLMDGLTLALENTEEFDEENSQKIESHASASLATANLLKNEQLALPDTAAPSLQITPAPLKATATAQSAPATAAKPALTGTIKAQKAAPKTVAAPIIERLSESHENLKKAKPASAAPKTRQPLTSTTAKPADVKTLPVFPFPATPKLSSAKKSQTTPAVAAASEPAVKVAAGKPKTVVSGKAPVKRKPIAK